MAHRHRWIFDVNPMYGEWHSKLYKTYHNKYGYKYSSYSQSALTDKNISDGLKLLDVDLDNFDSESINRCKKAFRKLILENHPDKSNNKDTHIIVCVSTAMEYLRNAYGF